MSIEQARKEWFYEAEKRGLFPVDLNSCPVEHDNISDERALTLFWWWSLDATFKYPKRGWMDDLTPEEKAFIEKLDKTKQETH